MGKWRRWNNLLHRDIGYLCVGLTVIFAISGIAVNHIDVWNPNYKIETFRSNVELSDAGSLDAVIKDIRTQLNIKDEAESTFKSSPNKLKIFFPDRVVEVNINSGETLIEIVKERFLLRDLNYLHLNHAKNIWPYISDLYAAALIFLSGSGLFILRGRNGLAGRGKWLTGLGILIPIFFLIIYKYL